MKGTVAQDQGASRANVHGLRQFHELSAVLAQCRAGKRESATVISLSDGARVNAGALISPGVRVKFISYAKLCRSTSVLVLHILADGLPMTMINPLRTAYPAHNKLVDHPQGNIHPSRREPVVPSVFSICAKWNPFTIDTIWACLRVFRLVPLTSPEGNLEQGRKPLKAGKVSREASLAAKPHGPRSNRRGSSCWSSFRRSWIRLAHPFLSPVAPDGSWLLTNPPSIALGTRLRRKALR